jgi:hypothetical protein
MASIRKLACGLKLKYKNGTQAEAIQGTDFTLDHGGARARFGFQVGNNLKSWNRGLACYKEAMEFIGLHALLESIEINERQVINALGYVAPGVIWQIEITLRPGLAFIYAAGVKLGAKEAIFTIERLVEGSAGR